MVANDLIDQRKLAALAHALGPTVLAALADPDVVEVLANPDGRLVLDRLGDGRSDSGETLAVETRERVIRLVADHVGETVSRADPRLAGVLPGGERFQGMLPPVVAGPAFSIRKRPSKIFTLSDYVGQAVMSARQAQTLRKAVRERCNILISGGTGSGKTTLANAVLAEPEFAQDRVIVIEDTPELQCSAWDMTALLTRRHPVSIGVADLVRDALRLRPDRMVIGEMRDGAAALETLKAWNTGHPGGLSTLHANSAEEALSRLDDLLGEVRLQPSQRLISQSVDRIVHIRRDRNGRSVEAILAVASSPSGGWETAQLA
jgi:P-type conjugative transfer ATPase TrbB